MKMGSLFRNRSLLELVHPGGFAEIRKKSISAAEVMKKNPRHFITRPEAILKPGNVFVVVPYHTVYRLLQTRKSQIPASLLQQRDHLISSMLWWDLPTRIMGWTRSYVGKWWWIHSFSSRGELNRVFGRGRTRFPSIHGETFSSHHHCSHHHKGC